MLEKLALISIIISGFTYTIKNLFNCFERYKVNILFKTISKCKKEIYENLSSVPTEIKKTKKKGK